MKDITMVKEKLYNVELETTTLTAENIKRALQVLIDNGIEPDEAGVVLQAIGYTLLDTELDCDGYEIASDGTVMYWEDGVEYTLV